MRIKFLERMKKKMKAISELYKGYSNIKLEINWIASTLWKMDAFEYFINPHLSKNHRKKTRCEDV